MNPARKKKELSPTPKDDPLVLMTKSFTSVFDASTKKTEPMFFPPEAFGSVFDQELEEPLDLENASSWDIATRYHEFKSKRSAEKIAKQLRRLSAQAILDRAKQVLGSVVHPMAYQSAPWPEVPFHAEQVEFDIENTLENAPLVLQASNPAYFSENDIWMTYAIHRKQAIVLCVDTSLSMTGEKLALTAVALSVVLLEFPEDPIGIVAFENQAKVLKHPNEKISVESLVERFLDVPAQGYTHLEEGMKAGLIQAKIAESLGKGKPPSVVLLTDGKYTAGRDPSYLATRFSHLVVLKMGKEKAGLQLCQELAQKGRGVLKEVDQLEALPVVMYTVVKDLLRGKSAN